jgi:hypothetical protein
MCEVEDHHIEVYQGIKQPKLTQPKKDREVQGDTGAELLRGAEKLLVGAVSINFAISDCCE